MKIETNIYQNGVWLNEFKQDLDSPKTLIIVFSTPNYTTIQKGFEELCNLYPTSIIVGCSTAGEIYNGKVYDETLIVSITQFENTPIIKKSIKINHTDDSELGGEELAKSFDQKDLKALLVLSDGLTINGSNLVQGLNKNLPKNVIITGGMAGDGNEFQNSWVIVNRNPEKHYVTAVGFYGDFFEINYAAKGGWNRFGLERLITSCDRKTSTIYTVDNKPILELYKIYMGEHANNLPASGLEFPFLIIDEDGDSKVRAIMDADEETQSVTIYGDAKEGDTLVFLKGSANYIIDGAQEAGEMLNYEQDQPALILTVSCMARRAVLKGRTEEEIEVLHDLFTNNISQLGFYSYGELSPQASGKCGLLNQTITLALFSEVSKS